MTQQRSLEEKTLLCVEYAYSSAMLHTILIIEQKISEKEAKKNA
jgi:hypothetical protein